jgi:hypothetical protein
VNLRAVLAIGFLALGLLGMVVFQVQVRSEKTQVAGSIPVLSSLTSVSSASVLALEQVEWESPENELKTERSKILTGMEASF